MKDFRQCQIVFENKELNNLCSSLNNVFSKQQNNFAELCTCVAKIYYYCKDCTYLAKDNEYYNAIKLLNKFGFNKVSVSRLVNCYEKYIFELKSFAGETNLSSMFFLFSPSKLYELLPVSNDRLLFDIERKFLTPDMTRKEIRNYVKYLKKEEEKDISIIDDSNKEIISEIYNIEEEPFYDYRKEYTMDFFESCNKEQLLAIVWTLQFEYQKLINKKK